MKKVMPANNYNSTTVKRGTIIGTLIRIHRLSPDEEDDLHNDLIRSINIAMNEYIRMGYNIKTINTAIRYLEERTRDNRLHHYQITSNKL